jgi:Capsular polysaccharide synthesis protein
MLKSLVKRTARTLLRHVPDVSLASSAYLPWPVKEKLAYIEMEARSSAGIGSRASFLPHARHVKRYRTPDCQHFGPVWQYWNSGAGGCPPLIRECMASVRRHTTGRQIIVLSDDTLGDYVTLPAHILAKREQIGATHFSEVLRVSLLAQHGGTWIDATVLLTGGIDEITSFLPFFMFTRPNDPYVISSWFIHSVAGHPLACAMRDLMTTYWVTLDELREYFMFHFMFESAITLHADLREHWKKTPIVFAEAPHLLQKALLTGSSSERLREICSRIPLHKLSWKFPEPAMQEAERIMNWAQSLEVSPTFKPLAAQQMDRPQLICSTA